MAKAGSGARAAAVVAMTAVTEEGRLLSDALAKATSGLEPSDTARAGRLATGALRWAGRSDRLLGPHLRMKPEEQVMNILRLALFEMYAEGTPSHAAVDGAVSLAARPKAGLVNGVLRNIQRRDPDWSALPVPSIQKWLKKRLVAAWGKEAVAAMEAVQATEPPLDLTLRDPATAEAWAQTLDAEILPTGSLRLRQHGQISALPGFAEGAWWVQDAGATMAVRVLDPKPGERILDLCAAPGGKAMQLAAAGATVTALDIAADRMARVGENLSRTGLAADLVVADMMTWEPDAPFDAILLDAPCSATGTLRRHPDLAYARDGSGIDMLTELQAAMLDRALGWLTPGGRLVYCTCSLLPEEGEAQRDGVLARQPNATLSDHVPEGTDPVWIASGGGLRLRPDHWAERGGIDGFFIMRLEKRP